MCMVGRIAEQVRTNRAAPPQARNTGDDPGFSRFLDEMRRDLEQR
jgi:hypothetical protein